MHVEFAMLIYDKNINDIELKDIDLLIKESITENKFLEYKCHMKKGEKSKLLKTVCGFANDVGGLFIYGLEEENGNPTRIAGVDLGNMSWDEKKLQIQNWIKASIEPRLDVEMDICELKNGNVVILIKVPKSWNPPHCVKNKNQRAFFIRRDGFTDSMEFDELKNMFDLNNSLVDKINNFRDERLSKFESENQDLYKAIFHAVPLNAFSLNSINLNKAEYELRYYQTIGGAYSYNFEGIYNPHGTFFKQLFRNGIFEIYCQAENIGECIPIGYFEETFLKFATDVYEFYQKIGIICPIIFFVSLTNVQGNEICSNGFIRVHQGVFDKKRSILNPNGIIIENESQIEDNVNNLFIPLWNHFGYTKDYK